MATKNSYKTAKVVSKIKSLRMLSFWDSFDIRLFKRIRAKKAAKRWAEANHNQIERAIRGE